MSKDGKIDQATGRVKEGAGAATGDEGLRREGQREQSKGKLKDAAKKVGDALRKGRG